MLRSKHNKNRVRGIAVLYYPNNIIRRFLAHFLALLWPPKTSKCGHGHKAESLGKVRATVGNRQVKFEVIRSSRSELGLWPCMRMTFLQLEIGRHLGWFGY